MLGKELEIRYQNDPNSGHYQVTPYAFMPRMGRKLVPPLTVDLGQGILRVMEEEHRQIHPELQIHKVRQVGPIDQVVVPSPVLGTARAFLGLDEGIHDRTCVPVHQMGAQPVIGEQAHHAAPGPSRS